MVEFTYSDDKTEVFPVEIVTERLRMVAVHMSEESLLDVFDVYHSDAYDEVVEYMGGGKHSTPKETAEAVENQAESFMENEGCSYFLYLRESGELVGKAGFGVEWDVERAGFFVWLLPEFQGRGLGVERGDAFLELMFDELCLECVRIGVLEENEASVRAIEKYVVENGGCRDGTFRNDKVLNGEIRDIVYYSITKSEWED